MTAHYSRALVQCVFCRVEPHHALRRRILVNMRIASALLCPLVALFLVGCAQNGADPAATSDVRVQDEAVSDEAEAEKAELVLYISNQSFDDENVRLMVAIDGVTVVEDDFRVEGQHNWIQFPLNLPPGEHAIIATTDSGATLRKTFEVPQYGTRYAVINHWAESDDAYITWRFQRQGPVFG